MDVTLSDIKIVGSICFVIGNVGAVVMMQTQAAKTHIEKYEPIIKVSGEVAAEAKTERALMRADINRLMSDSSARAELVVW